MVPASLRQTTDAEAHAVQAGVEFDEASQCTSSIVCFSVTRLFGIQFCQGSSEIPRASPFRVGQRPRQSVQEPFRNVDALGGGRLGFVLVELVVKRLEGDAEL